MGAEECFLSGNGLLERVFGVVLFTFCSFVVLGFHGSGDA